MYSLESPQRGDYNENTQHTFMLEKLKEIACPKQSLARTTRLKQLFMVPKVFKPLKFDCILMQIPKTEQLVQPFKVNCHSCNLLNQ